MSQSLDLVLMTESGPVYVGPRELVIVASKEFTKESRAIINEMTGCTLMPVLADDRWAVWKTPVHKSVTEGLLLYLEEQEGIHSWFSWRIF